MAAALPSSIPGSAPDRATPAALSMLAQLHHELDASRMELAEIAGGSLPAALRAGGLQGGLARAAATARRTGLTVDLLVDLSGPVAERLADDAVATVYFCCSEALQNVVKYAKATRAGIEVTAAGGELRFTVTDDGTGIDPARLADPGGGLSGLDDRVSLVGGWIAVESPPGGGTRVRGAVPASAVVGDLPLDRAVAGDTSPVIVAPVGTAWKAATP
jgi:signal transduction histidine kinase